MGRPAKEIDWNLVEKLMEAGCSGTQIAGQFRLTNDTFYRRFIDQYGIHFQEYRPIADSAGISNILLMQHAKAMNGSIPMLTWLGKVRAGQKEPENTQTVSPVQIQIDQNHKIMELQYQNLLLKKQLEDSGFKPTTDITFDGVNDNKPETKSELLRGDSSI